MKGDQRGKGDIEDTRRHEKTGSQRERKQTKGVIRPCDDTVGGLGAGQKE